MIAEEHENNESSLLSDSSNASSDELLMTTLAAASHQPLSHFNSYTFMYKLVHANGEFTTDSLFYSNYSAVLSKSHKFSQPAVHFVLDPCLNGSDIDFMATIHQNQRVYHQYMQQQKSTPGLLGHEKQLLTYSLTIDFFKPLLLAQFQSLFNNSNNESIQNFDENFSCLQSMCLNNEKTDLDYLDSLRESIKVQGHGGLLMTGLSLSSEFNLSALYELAHAQTTTTPDESDSVRQKVKCMLYFKLDLMGSEMERVRSAVIENEAVGTRLLKQLEDNLNVTLLELDKFKLLVSESDVITNLLLKLCNKLANLDNVMRVMTTAAPRPVDDVEILRQEFVQAQRKREEAVFLKNGIDKRAVFVSDFLQK
jgi:hypothetical protein